MAMAALKELVVSASCRRSRRLVVSCSHTQIIISKIIC